MKKTELQGYRKNFIKFLSVFMVIFPWITYLNLSQYSEAEKSVFGGYNGMSIDFFIHHKEMALIIAAILAVLWFVGERFLPQKVDNNMPLFKGQNKWLFILSGVFVAGTLIATIISKYKKNALWGSPTVGEGLWTLLAYVVLVMVFYNYFANGFGMSVLKRVVTVLGGITVVLTLVEWFYKPLLEIGLVQALVAPSKYAEVVSSMKATVFDSAISLTFYNPGYFGGFVCILLPFALLFCLQAKKVVEKVLYGILLAGLLFAVVTANTTTALYIALFELVLVLVVYAFAASSEKSSKKTILFQGIGVFAGAMIVLLLASGVTGNSFLNVFTNANSATGNVVEERFEIEDIQMRGNRLILVGEEATLQIAYEKSVKFYDGDGKVILPVSEGDNLVFTEPEYAHLSVCLMRVSEEMKGVSRCLLVDAGYQDTIDFFVLDNGTFSGVGQGGAILTDIGDAETPEGLKQFYGMFTGRGYAWINSLPILKDTLLIGVGPGNFVYYFKQFDYVGLLTTHESMKQLIDKPHNAYIQYAVNVGLPAAIAFFGMFVGALIKATKIYWKNRMQMLAQENGDFHIAAMIALAGFLIYSIINDSMVTVTPVMCMITGALLASCYMVEKNNK